MQPIKTWLRIPQIHPIIKENTIKQINNLTTNSKTSEPHKNRKYLL